MLRNSCDTYCDTKRESEANSEKGDQQCRLGAEKQKGHGIFDNLEIHVIALRSRDSAHAPPLRTGFG
ncbi:hypothetical protein ACC679_38940, partial [Rhizobium ruizarguesonis]